MADDGWSKRKKGTFAGLGLIAFGIVGALVGYVSDRHSFDVFRIIYASKFAVLHVVLWSIAGLCVIAWYNRPPDDELPFERRDDNLDGMR